MELLIGIAHFEIVLLRLKLFEVTKSRNVTGTHNSPLFTSLDSILFQADELARRSEPNHIRQRECRQRRGPGQFRAAPDRFAPNRRSPLGNACENDSPTADCATSAHRLSR